MKGITGATADFIRAHADDDIRQLALKGAKDPDVDLPFALDQIAGRQTARRKLPSWAATDGIIYPPHLSMEQCSSEQTANYKKTLPQPLPIRRGGDTSSDEDNGVGNNSLPVGRAGGGSFVDLTGGFGVDFSFMAQGFQEAVYVERQEHLCDIARHNFDILGLKAEVVCCDSVEYLHQMPHVDLIYIDPARRDDHGQRTYGISDCTPDVVALRDLLLEKADRVIIKLSPMLDWRKAVQDLGESYVHEVHIVSVQNECKELLLVLEETLPQPLPIGRGGDTSRPDGRGMVETDNGLRLSCVNILHDGNIEQFVAHTTPKSNFPPPYREGLGEGLYLYEPNASIMKAGCFNEVANTFGVSALAPNSHLFVSDSLVVDFPGRAFHIDAITTLNKRELRTALAGITQANITVRNFPLTVAQLRSRLKLSEGGSTYIFATTLADKSHVLLICRKTSTPV